MPTALDRLIQQALLQVLTPVFDPHFHDCSFGFRPGRSAHQAVERARQSIADGAVWVVDVDLASFFDRVGHDALMARVARRVVDKQVLRLIRRYLEAGVMADGVRQPSEQGTPQGSPLSPLLANVMLDDLDHELGGRGHRFVRYADDPMVYVGSERAGLRVMESKDRLRKLTARNWGVSMERRIRALNRFTVGWTAYFAYADTPRPFADLDEWLRRRLRQVRWKEWKRYRTRSRNLRALGIPERAAREWAGSRKGYWRIAGSVVLNRALPNAYWTELGLAGFSDPYGRFRDVLRTAGCGPACPVVWEGPG